MQVRAPDLVRFVMQKTGLEKPSEIAKMLGLTSYSSPQRVTRWIAGENEPDFDATLALLAAAGWLNEEALRAGLQAQRAEDAKASAQEAEESARRAASRRPARRNRETG